MAEKNQISEKELLHKLLESNVLLQSKVVELVSSIKENNKQVTLSIPKDFKKIASLDTILSLREI